MLRERSDDLVFGQAHEGAAVGEQCGARAAQHLADWLGARRVANTTQAALRLPRRLDDTGPQSQAREIHE